jgi:hypothetical protein
MRHSGVCLPRQYAAFAGIAYGHKTTAFLAKLKANRIASACRCFHNRAMVYHVHHRALYHAIGEPHSRLRRPVPAGAIASRLTVLDAVVANPEMVWLVDEVEKLAHFARASAVPVRCLPRHECRSQSGTPVRYFPDRLPIGIDAGGRAVLLYPITASSLGAWRGFLTRHAALLGELPAWTLRLVLAADFHADRTSCDAVVSRDLQAVLGAVGGERGRVEWQVLTAKYGHLSPLVADPSKSAGGVEEGEQVRERPSARPQPPLGDSAARTSLVTGHGR